MKKVFAVLVAGFFAAGAFAQSPAVVSVPSQSVHSVKHVVKHKHHAKKVVHRHHRKAPVRHRM